MNSGNTLKKPESEKGFLKNMVLASGIFVLLAIAVWIVSGIFNLHAIFHNPSHDLLFLNLQIFFALASSVLLIILLAQYLESYLLFRTRFTLAFVILAMVLIVHSITSNPLFFSAFGYEPMKGPFSIIPLFFTLIAAMVLLYLNRQ